MSIASNIETYINSGRQPNHRFQSWEHCYHFFQELFKRKNTTEAEKDHLALHLAFYLASWGMYRGSTQTLQKDYKIFIPVIDILLLWDNVLINNMPYNDVLGESGINKILELSQAIKSALWAQFGRNNQPPSHTLITKILLGTLCCVPALDDYFVKGFRKFRIDSTKMGNNILNENTLRLISQVFIDNINEFQVFREMGYPDAKLIDMAFWQEMVGK